MLYCVYGLESSGEATDVPGMEISTGGAMTSSASVFVSSQAWGFGSNRLRK